MFDLKPFALIDLVAMMRAQMGDVAWALRFPDRWTQMFVMGELGAPDGRVLEHQAWGTLEPELEQLRLVYKKKLGAKITAGMVEELQRCIGPDTVWRGVLSDIQRFQKLLMQELGKRPCLVLDEDGAKMFKDAAPFGQEFKKRFPEAHQDCLAAARCHALEVWPACAFHALRVSEFPLQALLGAMSPAQTDTSSWGTIIAAIEKRVADDKALPTGNRVFSRDRLEVINSVKGYMQSLKHTRNSRIMHIDMEVPNQSESRLIYKQVHLFASYAAQHVDGSGSFL